MNLDFVEPLMELVAAFDRAGIPHAIGGAIAYSFHAEPRATGDIDVNVFLPETESAPVLAVLADLGVSVEPDTRAEIERTGQTRLRWQHLGLDVFFATVPFLDSCRERVQRVPFSGRHIPILTAEDLAVCKIMFNRDKDWIDLRQMVAIQGDALDVAYIRAWLHEMLGEDDGRIRRFEDLLTEVSRQLHELDQP